MCTATGAVLRDLRCCYFAPFAFWQALFLFNHCCFLLCSVPDLADHLHSLLAEEEAASPPATITLCRSSMSNWFECSLSDQLSINRRRQRGGGYRNYRQLFGYPRTTILGNHFNLPLIHGSCMQIFYSLVADHTARWSLKSSTLCQRWEYAALELWWSIQNNMLLSELILILLLFEITHKIIGIVYITILV